ncbi:sensor histidine kinase [Lutimonas zeaxanthinifaciens]|uniref:sensor histidine kinase n=1 Tax=Lutimonas zeaxanthinifaciens TaxID=3060215 RepID=UPI00265CC47B|nr:sensor histidine kinase [Lutimonas sp. YSD2104]WKK66642.1 two-component regulator propeller domain-containing protein [Lutimonas sp. YSD2104]
MRQKEQSFKSALTILVVFLLVPIGIMAQKEKIAFEKYGVEEGLPEEYVTSMIQDDQGFIWATTQNGLVKFDGYDIKVIRGDRNINDSTKLKFRHLGGGIIKSRDGKLWLGGLHQGGIASYDPKTERFNNFLRNSKDSTGIPFEMNRLQFEDSNDNIWFVSRSLDGDTAVVARINTKTNSIKTYPYIIQGFKYNEIVLNFRILEADIDKSIWLLEDKGQLRVFNREKDTFEIVIPTGSVIPGTGVKDTLKGIVNGKKHFVLNGIKGFYIWDPVKNEANKSYTNIVGNGQLLSSDPLIFAFGDSEGQFWLLQDGGNITVVNPYNQKVSKYTWGKESLDFNKGIDNCWLLFPLIQDSKGIWFQAYCEERDYAFVYYEHSTHSFKYYNNQFFDFKNQLPSRGNPIKVLEDKTGLKWLATRPYFYKQSPKARRIDLYLQNAQDEFWIPSDTIYHLVEDTKNRLWVGTESGIALKLPNNNFHQYYFNDSDGRKKDLGPISSIHEDTKGRIWVGNSHSGLFLFNEKKQVFDRIKIFETVSDRNEVQVSEDRLGNIWASIRNRGVYVLNSELLTIEAKFEPRNKDEHGLMSYRISYLFKDSEGDMWLGDPGNNDFGLYKYLAEQNRFKNYQYSANDSLTLINNEIRGIYEDDMSRMWVGTDGGLCLYDRESDVFFRNNREFDLPSVQLHEKAGNGRVWVTAYSGGGLALVGPGVNDVELFGEEKGLLHNDANNAVMDDQGRLWIPTQRGLSVFDTLSKTYTSYFEKDGYQKNGRWNPAVKTSNGDIWIGGMNGLNRIFPNYLFKKDSTQPAVLITSVGILDSLYSAPDGSIFKEAVSYTTEIKLKHWQKDLSFEFVALHYLRSEENLYSWKLENYDNKWSSPSKQREVSYTNLSPGNYVFRVKGSNADGIWNEEGASIRIIIAPPWWFTWWAYVVYALIAGLIGLQVHKFQKARTLRIARQNAQEKELAQAREIEKAYSELKSTQAQLIQSEKMASLGELTAGIAHEIQNPLNFVNNFSEVSNELLDELNEEIEKGDLGEVKGISEDLKLNLEKINHHGKRADSIVKGMLHHSRGSDGEKELTDINALADEYLRLAYHGLRAKDKSFNVTMKTDFDKRISEIKLVAQDVGRVVLNLITNAFYAVDEKKKSGIENYEPTVTVGTKKVGKNIEIKVVDNGNGIPEKVLDKIFQPFFTTKPTGQGTGLGLSLSYDIVTAHGGELSVETKENTGTEFKIILPI